jgi:hypothetical protein
MIVSPGRKKQRQKQGVSAAADNRGITYFITMTAGLFPVILGRIIAE